MTRTPQFIAYLSKGRGVRTAYLSLTRGEGGQNLIGPEIGDPLGVIRTQELLAARRVDGGQQFFTRRRTLASPKATNKPSSSGTVARSSRTWCASSVSFSPT